MIKVKTCNCPIHGNVTIKYEELEDGQINILSGFTECTNNCPLSVFSFTAPQSDDTVKVFDKIAVVASPRPLSTVQFFSSIGYMDSGFDDESALYIYHKTGDNNLSTRIYFKTIEHKTYLQGGLLSWENMKPGDLFKAFVVPLVTKFEPGENTSFSIYNNYLIVPAIDNGTINITEMNLVEVPISVRTGKPVMPGYWDATWDSETKQFVNVMPNIKGEGKFNMFATEINLAEFIPGLLLNGTNYNFTDFRANEPMQIAHNMGIKIEMLLKEDHDAYVGIVLLGYKE